MTDPRDIDIEHPNPNPDEVTDDGLGIPDVIEVVTDADVDEDEPEDDGSSPTHEGEPE